MSVGNPLDSLGDEVNELVSSFKSQAIFGNLDVAGFTQYSFWFAVAIVLMLILLFAFKKRQSKGLVPKGVFVNGMEYLVEFVRDDMCKGLLGESWKRHFPFIASIFLVVLANNIVGIIPGCKPGTGTISTTAALAVCSFVYFIVCGVKKHGALGYAKSLAPAGVAFPLNALVWLIEVFSTILRLITLAVRLFCNLFAGHVVMGTFAILASLFFEPMIQAFSVATAIQAGASVLWVGILLVIYVVEIMVAAIQAYVFALLSAVYIQIAESDEE
ncbi:F0F1 ATP synthase subunit A [Olsenella uli]|nr:F0F1 ATP synthase subunit A [Olsenella uli]